MKVAIVGSRDFAWRPASSTMGKEVFIQQAVGLLGKDDYVVSGGANGADFWAEYFAKLHRTSRIIHEADWDKKGKGAGHLRNTLIVKDADCVLAFFTDRTKSRGTVDTVRKATEKGIPVYTFDAATEEIPSWQNTWHDEMMALTAT